MLNNLEPYKEELEGCDRASPIKPDSYEIIDEEIDEEEWLYAATRNPAFDFLKDPEEDIYTLADGRPFKLQNAMNA